MWARPMRITRQALEVVLDHATRQWPRECCGILLARDGSQVASAALEAANEEPQRPETRYILGHEAHLKAVEMEFAGEATIVGYYHSHPRGGPEPSARDRELAAEGASYLIAGRRDEEWEAAAWRFTGRGFEPEPLEVVP